MAIKTDSWEMAQFGLQMSGSYSCIESIEWSKGRAVSNQSISYCIVGVRHYASSESRAQGNDPVSIQTYSFNALNMTGSLGSNGFFGEIYDKLKEHTDGPFSGSTVQDI